MSSLRVVWIPRRKNGRTSIHESGWGCAFSRVSPNLGTLALYIGTSPAVSICIDTRPYKLDCNELLGCSDSWMGQTMKGVKHSTLPCQWDEGVLCSSGRVTVKWCARVSQWDSFHNQCRRWGGLESSNLWVSGMCLCHSSKVHSG